MKKIAVVLMATLLVALAGTAFAADQLNLDTLKVTDVAGKELAGKNVFGGKTTVIAFAQTACANCRDEISYLSAIAKDFPKVQFAVAIVDMRPNEARINSYLGELEFKGVVLTDAKYALAKEVGVNTTPSLAVVQQDGKVSFRQFGYDEAAKAKIKDALK